MKLMIGRVVSNKMQKTAVVLVETRKVHPLYKKSFIRSKKYLADDPFNVQEGDIVEIVETRPLSKRKHWRITRVLGRDVVALGEQELKEEAEAEISEVLPEEGQKEKEAGETPATEEATVPSRKRSKKEDK